jgi:hypothetical protein
MRLKPSVLVLATAASLAGRVQAATHGYVQLTLTNGYNFSSLQLDWDGTLTNNTIYSTFATNVPDGTKIYLWDITNQVFTAPSVYSAASRTWSLNYTLPLGQGFVVQAAQPWTVTLVGNIPEGFLTNIVAGNNKLSLLSIMPPLGVDLTTRQFPETDGASLHLFRSTNQTYSDAFTYFTGYGWFDPNGVVNTNGPVIAITRAFFVRNPGPDRYWVQNFVVPLINSQGSGGSTGPNLRSLSLANDVASLRISNPKTVPYNIEFSTNFVNWTTVATHQTGSIWKEARPASARGFYRLESP